jgi:hypothetical protein
VHDSSFCCPWNHRQDFIRSLASDRYGYVVCWCTKFLPTDESMGLRCQEKVQEASPAMPWVLACCKIINR